MKNDPSKWMIFKNTHEAIIEESVFEVVQRIRDGRRRLTPMGEMPLLSGMMFCADCGNKIYQVRGRDWEHEKEYFVCATYRKIKGGCSSHRIRNVVVEEFFASLKERGLKDVRLITSDNHKGLVNAVKRHFQGATWQRCQTHFSRNMLDHTPKALQPVIKEDLRELYEAVDLDSARKVRDQLLGKYGTIAPKAATLLDESFDDVTAILAVPLKYRKRLRTTNGVERLNQEVRRRERVIRIFPNEASVIRLIGALLMEQDEKWQAGRKYFDMDLYYQSMENKKTKDRNPAA
jgi:transposase-like protein